MAWVSAFWELWTTNSKKKVDINTMRSMVLNHVSYSMNKPDMNHAHESMSTAAKTCGLPIKSAKLFINAVRNFSTLVYNFMGILYAVLLLRAVQMKRILDR